MPDATKVINALALVIASCARSDWRAELREALQLSPAASSGEIATALLARAVPEGRAQGEKVARDVSAWNCNAAVTALQNWWRHFDWCATKKAAGQCDCGLDAEIQKFAVNARPVPPATAPEPTYLAEHHSECALRRADNERDGIQSCNCVPATLYTHPAPTGRAVREVTETMVSAALQSDTLCDLHKDDPYASGCCEHCTRNALSAALRAASPDTTEGK